MDKKIHRRHPSIDPVHPGEILREDIFPSIRMTKPAFASALGVSRQTLHQIMICVRGITPEMALRLEAVVGGTAETWLRLQADYDLWQRRQTLDVSKLKRVKAA